MTVVQVSELMDLLSSDSALAAFTLALAIATAYLAYETRTLAKEDQRNRELQWRPYFVAFQHVPGHIFIDNLGKGPGMNVRYCRIVRDQKGEEALFATEPFDMPPRLAPPEPLPSAQKTSHDVPLKPEGQAWIQTVLSGIAFERYDDKTEWKHAVVCEDRFETYYRFRLRPGEKEPDTWRRGQRRVPDWIYWPPQIKGTDTDPAPGGALSIFTRRR